MTSLKCKVFLLCDVGLDFFRVRLRASPAVAARGHVTKVFVAAVFSYLAVVLSVSRAVDVLHVPPCLWLRRDTCQLY